MSNIRGNEVKYENGVFSIIIDAKHFEGKGIKEKLELEKNINRFVNTLIENCKFFSIRYLIEKLKTANFVHLEKPKELLNGEKLDGEYDEVTNTLSYINVADIFHELFHMTAKVITEKYAETENTNTHTIKRWGLSFNLDAKNTDSEYIGIGLDEGMTELLRYKYFKSKDKSSYFFEMQIAKHVANLIGENELEKSYYSNEYTNVLLKLSKYTSFDETVHFLDCLDYYYKVNIGNKKKPNIKMFEECKEYIDYISWYLRKAYTNKLRMEKISIPKRAEFFDSKLWFFENSITISGKKKNLDFISDEEFANFYNKANGYYKKGINR